jgi:hypothetical protein
MRRTLNKNKFSKQHMYASVSAAYAKTGDTLRVEIYWVYPGYSSITVIRWVLPLTQNGCRRCPTEHRE